MGTNLTEVEVVKPEAIGFKLKDGEVRIGQSLDLFRPLDEIVIEPHPPTI